LNGKGLGSFSIVIAGLQCQAVRLCYLRHARKLPVDPFEALRQRALIEPVHQSEGEEILAAGLHRTLEIQAIQGVERQGGDRHRVQLVAGAQFWIIQRVFLITGLGQVARRERVPVNDQNTIGLQPWQIGLERCRIHRHQDIGIVTGSVNLLA
jgi:hypothetical protein